MNGKPESATSIPITETNPNFYRKDVALSTADFAIEGIYKSDRCNGREADGEVCGNVVVSGRIVGGGMLSVMFGWFNWDLGVEAWGAYTCKSDMCYNVVTGQFRTSPMSCGNFEAYWRGCAGLCYTGRLF